MRKSLVVMLILALSAGFASVWVYVESIILEKTHPLPYEESVTAYSKEYAVPKEVVYAVMNTESKFKSDAVSDKGAIGLMQITPDTYYWLCQKLDETENIGEELLYNPDTNIRYGTYLLSLLYTEFGVWDTVFAAYNAGRGKVQEWLKDETHNQNGKIVNIPYPETAAYVEKVNKNVLVYKKLYFNQKENQESPIKAVS